MRIASFGKNLDEKPEAGALPEEGRALLVFDSGKCVSFEAALVHLLVFGTTGSGKTWSAIRPGLLNHFMAGHTGLVVDIKGNMRGIVRAMAKKAGRERDVIELGTAPPAMPMNLLEGMSLAQCYEFFLDLMSDSFNGQSHNMDFHVKGVGMARDIFRFMEHMREAHEDLAPDIQTINEMFHNPQKATEAFDYFVENLADRNDAALQDFIDVVRNSQFHVLTQTRKKLDRASSNHFEQLSYNTHSLKNALKQLMDVPGVLEKFFRHGAPALDMARMLDEGKILVLRFGPDSGAIGARLSRVLINRFYEAVYKRGVSCEKRQSFVCIDEFQEVADLSDGRFSDTNFIAQAREFRSGFMAATQSAAALLSRGANAAAVEAFVSNCNSKISFFSDDPFTRELAKRYDPALDLIDLKPGQAFVVGYDADTREHFWGVDTLRNAYESTRELEPEEGAENPWEGPERTPLRGLLARLRELAAARTGGKGEKMERDDAELRRERAGRKPEPEVRTEPLPDWMKEKYAGLFADSATVHIPAGWRKMVEHGLDLYMEMDLSTKLLNITIDSEWKLRAVTDKGRRENEIFNALLEKAGNLCMVCGARLEQPAGEASDDDEDKDEFDHYGLRSGYEASRLPVCGKCLSRHSLDGAGDAQRRRGS